MTTPAANSGLRDNHARGMVADFLRAKIQSGSRLSVVSAYFTIYAYDALEGEAPTAPGGELASAGQTTD
jgi:hypothetical protein